MVTTVRLLGGAYLAVPGLRLLLAPRSREAQTGRAIGFGVRVATSRR